MTETLLEFRIVSQTLGGRKKNGGCTARPQRHCHGFRRTKTVAVPSPRLGYCPPTPSEIHGRNPPAIRLKNHRGSPYPNRGEIQTANRRDRPSAGPCPCHPANRNNNRPARAPANRPAIGPDRARNNRRPNGVVIGLPNRLPNRSGNGSQGDSQGLVLGCLQIAGHANLLPHSELRRRLRRS